jgi:hypothetical protein
MITSTTTTALAPVSPIIPPMPLYGPRHARPKARQGAGTGEKEKKKGKLNQDKRKRKKTEPKFKIIICLGSDLSRQPGFAFAFVIFNSGYKKTCSLSVPHSPIPTKATTNFLLTLPLKSVPHSIAFQTIILDSNNHKTDTPSCCHKCVDA